MNRNGAIFLGVLATVSATGWWAWETVKNPYVPPPDLNTPEGRARERAAVDLSLAGPMAFRLVEAVPPVYRKGKILINSPDLVAGIPGAGPLKLDEIQRWLEDPRNHETIDFEVPIGMDSLKDQISIPADNPLTRAKIELGRQLFHDRRLGGVGGREGCVICHVPLTFSDPGVGGAKDKPDHDRSVPTGQNRLFSKEQFWDGRASSLEDQVTQPIFNPNEMVNDPPTVLATLNRIPGYRMQFDRVFGGVSLDALRKALASYMRTLVTNPTRYDYAVHWESIRSLDPDSLPQGEREEYELVRAIASSQPLTAAEQRGRELFFSDRMGCSKCHSGPNFTDEKYHNLGYAKDAAGKDDPGRYAVTKDEKDRGAFKTPTLRQVSMTGPYMHNNSLHSIQEIISVLAQGGGPGSNKSPLLKPFDISKEEKADLAAFVASLTSPALRPEAHRIPESVPINHIEKTHP